MLGRLKRHGYYVFDPTQLLPNGDDFWDQYDEQLEIAADRGFVLFMLNLKSLRSRWSQREIEIALEKASSGGSVIILNMEPLNEIVENLLVGWEHRGCIWIDFSHGEFETNISTLVDHMRTCKIA